MLDNESDQSEIPLWRGVDRLANGEARRGVFFLEDVRMRVRRIVHYNPELRARAKALRKAGNLAEVLLWQQLKRRQLGYDFHRQKPIGEFIVDFYCPALALVIEIDGASHIGKEEYDMRRQAELRSLGLHVLRFWDNDVRDNLNGVLHAIREWIESSSKNP